MCYAIPGKITEIHDGVAVVDYFGEKKQAYNELDGLSIGDYVYAQGGFVIKAVSPEEARSILAVWKETFFALQEHDLRLSRLDLSEKGVSRQLVKILDKAAEGRRLQRDELLYLLELEDEASLSFLYKTANFLRQKNMDNSCCVHGIIELSSFCVRNCKYCGISTHNRVLDRYRMSREQVLACAKEAVETYGFQALVLQSGEDPSYDTAWLCDIIREIKARHAVLIFISFGEMGLEPLEELYAAGARGLLMRFETSNPALYQELHPGYVLSDRLAHLERARELGYLIISGGLSGIPGQTAEDVLNDILLTRELGSEMYSFGPFIPHPDTPLNGAAAATSADILKTIAVSRIVDPGNAKILVTTAFETIDPLARINGLMAGANSVMLNVSPEELRQGYAIYPERAHGDESIQKQIESTLALLYDLGRAPTDLGKTPTYDVAEKPSSQHR